jgi:GT2 family glycosyltransferase
MTTLGEGPRPRVAVVILSWNGLEDTLDCLSSLERVDYDELSVIVVDNGSTDGTAEAVRREHPDAELIRSERNLGFSAGNNLGLERALADGAEYVFLLNNDTLVDPGFLTTLVDEARRRPDAGALCPLVLYADPPDVIWYAGARFDPRRGHNGKQTGYGERDSGRFREVEEVERATGAAMLVPRAVLEEVGLLDESLYFFVEDVDWSLRMRANGLRLYLVPKARIRHRVSRGSGGENTPNLAYYGMRNTLEVCHRHGPHEGPAALRRDAEIVLAQILHARRGRHPVQNLRAAVEGFRDYRRGRLGKRGETLTPQ